MNVREYNIPYKTEYQTSYIKYQTEIQFHRIQVLRIVSSHSEIIDSMIYNYRFHLVNQSKYYYNSSSTDELCSVARICLIFKILFKILYKNASNIMVIYTQSGLRRNTKLAPFILKPNMLPLGQFTRCYLFNIVYILPHHLYCCLCNSKCLV